VKIKGIYTPVVTPFRKNYEIDYESLEKILKFLLKKKIHGIVVGGTTGEYFSLNFQERIQLFEFIKKIVGNKCQLIAGTTAINANEAIELSLIAKYLGYKCILLGSPPYSQPTQEESAQFFLNIAKKVQIPIMMYNFPEKMAFEIKEPFLKKVMSNKFFTSIKHNSSNPAMIRHFASNYPSLQIACGNDLQFLEFCSWGSESWVGGMSNCFPQLHIEIYKNAIINKNFDKARDRLLKLKQIIDYVISIGKYTQSVKFIMKELALCNELCRPPYLTLNIDEKKKVKKYLNLILK
jgi:4-hydroxy-tetrahydrodipicolinate synthase